jgi:hypothetical protein
MFNLKYNIKSYMFEEFSTFPILACLKSVMLIWNNAVIHRVDVPILNYQRTVE